MKILERAANNALVLSWLISLLATAGSLIFQYVLSYEPCMLCWYQRITMYPLVIVLGIAAYRNDGTIRPYVLPLAIIGLVLAIYQYLEQMVPGIARIAPCTVGVPCSSRDINLLGFITFPLLSLCAFAVITFLLSLRSSD